MNKIAALSEMEFLHLQDKQVHARNPLQLSINK